MRWKTGSLLVRYNDGPGAIAPFEVSSKRRAKSEVGKTKMDRHPGYRGLGDKWALRVPPEISRPRDRSAGLAP